MSEVEVASKSEQHKQHKPESTPSEMAAAALITVKNNARQTYEIFLTEGIGSRCREFLN